MTAVLRENRKGRDARLHSAFGFTGHRGRDISVTLGISDKEFESAIDEAARTARIDLAHSDDFTIGPVAVAPSLRTIEGPDGKEVIEPKVMQALIALGDQEGCILSRDDLIARCWEGRVVGESSINRVISLLRSALKSVCGDVVIVENVPKVGYRVLLSPDWKPVDDTPAPSGVEDTTSDRGGRPGGQWGAVILAACVAALLAAAASIYAVVPTASSVEPEPIKVAMLPLKTSQSVDPLYARGLEAELRSQLARVGRFEVTSSESARQLFAQGLSADEICRRLGADYAWVGALEIGADRVTLSANLIDAQTKRSAYRETLSSAPNAAQNLPLRTARAITSALGRAVSDRMPQLNVSAGDYRLYLTALGLIKGRGVEQREAALEILEQVTADNPDFADGWAGLAKAHFLSPVTRMADKTANQARAGEIAEKALALDPNAVDALKVRAMLDTTPKQERLALMARATRLDPGDSEAWYWRALVQGEFVLDAGSPVESAQRMVDLDPLWPASWRASDLAAQFGDMEAAYAIEEAVASAAVTPSQRLLSQARRAMLDGDLSGFVQFTRQAQPTASAAERLFGTKVQLHWIERLVGLPHSSMQEGIWGHSGPLMEAIHDGRLPPREAFAAEDADGTDFWDDRDLVQASLPLFLRDQREVELAEYYDAAFAANADYLAAARAEGQEHTFIPSVSPYLALAFRRLGRDADANWHAERAREQVERWKAANTGSVDAVIFELMLAALEGDQSRAIELVQRLNDHAWPYLVVHTRPTSITLLQDDPLYASIRDLPEVRAALDPIRANLAKEREEVLALGVS